MYVDKDINYIYNYVKYVYISIDEFKDENYLMDISKRIRNSMINSTFTDGKLDFYINNFVGQELRVRNSSTFRSFETIKNHIYLLMNYYKIYHGVNIENYNVVLYEITRIVSDKYDCNDVINGKHDSIIEKMIQDKIKSGFNPEKENVSIPLNILYISSKNGKALDSKELIRKYVDRYLQTNVNKVFEFNGDLNYLSYLITNEVCKMGIDTKRLLNRKCDDLINTFLIKNTFGIKYTELFNEMYFKVKNYVFSNETYMDLPNKEEIIDMEIFKLSKYLITLGYNKEDVISGKCNEIMDYHLCIDTIMVNSTICKENHALNKFPLSLNKKSSSKKSKSLLSGVVSAIMSLGNKKVITENTD